MATTPRRGKPYIWASWLTGILSGDKQCGYAPWFKAHFRYDKRPDPTFDSAAWSADHQVLLLRRKAELEAEGWTVSIEHENALSLEGRSAILAGKPDLVATRESVLRIVDAKTGKPKSSDWWQVLIYMTVLPMVRPAAETTLTIEGEVAYGDHVKPVAPEELTEQRREQIYAALRACGADARPAAVPSKFECDFCDIADCEKRFRSDAKAATAMTGAF